MLADTGADEFRQSAHALAELMTRRRSVRRLRRGSLDQEALARIVEAARRTPAAYNRPPWRVTVVHDRREPFWNAIESAFRAGLDGDRLDRYLRRLDGFRTGIGAVLIHEDREAVAEMQAAYGIDAPQAQAYSEQGLGMVQLALWLAIVAEGLATSLQHWESLIEADISAFLDLPAERYRLVATMPLGYAAEAPHPVQLPEPHHLVSLDACREGGACRQRND